MSSQPIARTGRVQSWIDDPHSRLPVSCTVFVVEDEMEGENGIEASWRFVSHALRYGAGCAVHLSKLRPKGHINDRGLEASGPVSFAKMYSVINETLRRGGIYKNGAVVLHLDYTHPDALQFIQAKPAELPWVKRCLDVDKHFFEHASQELIDSLLLGIRKGHIWLNKIRFDGNGQRIYGNVCLEVYLPSRGTCLLEHINLGACKPDEVPFVFVQGMRELVDLHSKTGVGDSGEYLPPEKDRQVGLGILGLANFLAQNEVSYRDFGFALDRYFLGIPQYQEKADYLVEKLASGVLYAAHVARQAGMQRAFAIAPTANCSYRYTDLRGYTTTPELAPPISRSVDRDSGTFGVESFDYPPDVEIASEVGWKDYKRVADGIVRLFQETLLFHGYSFNSWSDVVTYDEAFLRDWLSSPQTSLYYSLQVMPDTQAKDDALAALDESYREFFKFDEIDTPHLTDEDDPVGFCPIDGSCSSCAE
jgi:hypothetical protein